MIEIPLTQNKVALIDDEDFELVSSYTWVAAQDKQRECWYAVAWNRGVGGTDISLHRLIMGVDDPHIDVDHKDTDGLNNQKSNLRLCTRMQNKQNSKPYRGGSSRYKGVSRRSTPRGDRFTAYIRVNRHLFYIGIFSDEVEAAQAYDKAALEHFGEFARINTYDS